MGEGKPEGLLAGGVYIRSWGKPFLPLLFGRVNLLWTGELLLLLWAMGRQSVQSGKVAQSWAK